MTIFLLVPILTPTQLLDDDAEVIGRYYPDCASDDLLPAYAPGEGTDYFELDIDSISEDEIAELFGESSKTSLSAHKELISPFTVGYLLMHTLRERMYSLTKIIYNQQRLEPPKSPLHRLRRRAGRSIANLRDSFRRTMS